MTEIRFGTDGWRDVIADGYTFERVRIVAGAIAAAARQFEVPDDVDRNTLIVGYDRRFLSREFAEAAAEVMARAGYRVLLSNAPTPSQTIAFAAKNRKVVGGIVITASHNPAKYNGIKFKGWYGGSALPEMYAAIVRSLGESPRREGGAIDEVDILDDYIDALREFLDLGKLRDAKISILHDAIYGVAASIPQRVVGAFAQASSTVRKHPGIRTIRGEINPSFGGVNPEPIPENLAATREAMESGEFDLAICNDGDADRLGILDERGEFVSPQKTIAMLALYLTRHRGMQGELVKTFSTTRLIEKIAPALGVRLTETPIGFKYVADLMLTRNVLIGGEESGGIGIGAFLPERDGILSGLLVAEAVASHGKPLSRIVDEMEEEFGVLHYDRRDLHRPMPQCERLVERAKSGEIDDALGGKVVKREEVDGVKLNLADGSWILFRKSGTEPIIRIYCESGDRSKVTAMLDGAVAELDRVF